MITITIRDHIPDIYQAELDELDQEKLESIQQNLFAALANKNVFADKSLSNGFNNYIERFLRRNQKIELIVWLEHVQKKL